PFQSYFSGNTIQICPVGALTSAAYRFRSRPFDLVSTLGACEHCASGCALRTDSRRGVVLRRLAGHDPAVNEEWNCDKGRFAFTYGKFARIALGTNDIDFRARPHSAEELDFLATHVVGVTPETGGVTYDDLSAAPAVLCVAFEPEEESPIVYLRLRRAARDRRLPVWHLGQFTTPAVRRTF